MEVIGIPVEAANFLLRAYQTSEFWRNNIREGPLLEQWSRFVLESRNLAQPNANSKLNDPASH
jgi:hypothetical protein